MITSKPTCQILKKKKKQTWTGINEVSFRRKKKLNAVIAIKDPICNNKLVKDFSHIPNIADEHLRLMGLNA